MLNDPGSYPFIRVGLSTARPATPPSRAGFFYFETDTGNLYVVQVVASAFSWALAAAGPSAHVARLASTANVTVAGPGANLDGVAMVAGDVVLLRAQTAGAENGLYVFNGAAVPLTRAPGFDASAEVTGGLIVTVTEGDVNRGTAHVLANSGTIVVGTTALVFRDIASNRNVTDNSGTPGATTISRYAGKAAIAAGAASVVVTNALVAATSLVFVTPIGGAPDATLTGFRVTIGAGSFTVTGNANATAAWPFSFLVINP